MTRIYDGGRYTIDSTGNGAFFTITRKADNASVFLQGDDAVSFGDEMERANERRTIEHVCSDYDEVMA